MSNQQQREIYPNDKLDRVHFEIRFYPLLEIDNKIVIFQKNLRTNLPNYRIEQLLKKDSMGIQEQNQHIFSSEDNYMILKITNSNFVFSIANYEGYESFSTLVNSVVNQFLTQFNDIRQFLFTGIRYVNKFEFNKTDTDLNRIIEFFDIGLDSAEILEKKIDNIKLEIRYKILNADFKRLFILNTDKKLNQFNILIDLDSFKSGKITTNDYISTLDELHLNIKNDFEKIITERLKDEILRVTN